MQIVAKMSPAEFDELLKVLKIFASNKSLSVRQNTIVQSIGTSIVKATCSVNVPDLDISDLSTIKFLENLKRTTNDIEFYDLGPLYLITNNEISIKIPKAHSTETPPDSKIVGDILDTVKIDDVFAQAIATYTRDMVANIHITEDEKLLGISTNEVDILMPRYIGQIPITQMEQHTKTKLKSKTFMPVRIKSTYTFTLLKSNNNYYLQTTCTIGNSTIDAYEALENMDSLDAII